MSNDLNKKTASKSDSSSKKPISVIIFAYSAIILMIVSLMSFILSMPTNGK